MTSPRYRPDDFQDREAEFTLFVLTLRSARSGYQLSGIRGARSARQDFKGPSMEVASQIDAVTDNQQPGPHGSHTLRRTPLMAPCMNANTRDVRGSAGLSRLLVAPETLV